MACRAWLLFYFIFFRWYPKESYSPPGLAVCKQVLKQPPEGAWLRAGQMGVWGDGWEASRGCGLASTGEWKVEF